MSCGPHDLRDYFLNELNDAEGAEVRQHLKQCPACREELSRLRATEAALLSIRDEELPRRIAFVADRPARRAWWSAWGLAPAGVLSAALIVSAFVYRGRPVAVAPPAPRIDTAQLEADFSQRLDAAVRKAVAESEERQARKTAALLQTAERKADFERKQFQLAVEKTMEYWQKRNNVLRASVEYGAGK